MNAMLMLFTLGVILLAAEVFMVGIICGVLGAIAMLIGCVLAFQEFGTAGGVFASVGATALLGLTLYAELVWLPKTRFGRKMVVESTVDGVSQPQLAEEALVVGKAAEAVTTLAPSGYVLVEGKRYEAFCRSGHAEKGARLTVLSVDNFRLVVSKS